MCMWLENGLYLRKSVADIKVGTTRVNKTRKGNPQHSDGFLYIITNMNEVY